MSYYLLKLFVDSTDNELRNLYTDFASKHNTLVDRVLRGTEHVDAGTEHVDAGTQHVDAGTEHVDAGTEHVDAGIDLFCPDKLIMAGRQTGKVDHCVKAAMEFMANHAVPCGLPVGYYLYPRSSTGTKTPLRLANSVGIIDSGYRGHIIAVFDNWQDVSFTVEPYQRLVQLCPPNLTYPVYVELVKKESDLGVTVRGGGGFGSTGK